MREDPSQPFEVTYELPDGSFIKLHDELFMYAPILFPPLSPSQFISRRATEPLFSPRRIKILPDEGQPIGPLMGFTDLLVNTIQAVPLDEPNWHRPSNSLFDSLPQEIISAVDKYVITPTLSQPSRLLFH